MNKAAIKYQKDRREHWNSVACDKKRTGGNYYHRRLEKIYQSLVLPDQKVLEIGCGKGDLISSLNPSFGVGIDFSFDMIGKASQQYKNINFIQCDAHNLCIEEKFDVVIISDLVNDLWDVQKVFEQVRKISTPRTRIIINTYSRLWELPLRLTQKLGLSTRVMPQNWLTVEDLTGLLNLTDTNIIRHWEEIIWPFNTNGLSEFFNRFIAKIWPFRYFALTNLIIARPRPIQKPQADSPLVSVIVAARNEAGNIASILERTPEMGRGTEIVFVEGGSDDDTASVIKKMIKEHPERRCSFFQQTGKGKGDAVRLGFSRANGDILMILDADLTVRPEDLPKFYEALVSQKGEFINGVRLVYPMEEKAMRFFNLLGNKFFSIAFSWLLGQPIKDTLCGTKVLRRSEYERIAENRKYFGDFDPFGDFDLLFGAARLNLKIVEMPIRYAERIYGSTNISRWSHGWLLIRMMLFASRRIKFV